jgi:dipeptidyl aminopeptidase/acylaminoacyl peptidase
VKLIGGENLYPAWSPDGKWLARFRRKGQETELLLINQESKSTLVLDKMNTCTDFMLEWPRERSIRWSPSGNQIAYCAVGSKSGMYLSNLCVVNLKSKERIQLTHFPRTYVRSGVPIVDRFAALPEWSPDERRILFQGFASISGEASGPLVISVQRSGAQPQNLPADDFWTWGRDGQHLLSGYWSIHPEKSRWGIWLKELDLGTNRVKETFYEARFPVDRRLELSIYALTLSPDKKKLLVEADWVDRFRQQFVGRPGLYVAHLNEKRLIQVVTVLRYLKGYFHSFPDSQHVGYLQVPSGTKESNDASEVWVSSIDGKEKHKVGWIPAEKGIMAGEKISDCAWSPDGSRIAFTVDLEGKKKERPLYVLKLNLSSHINAVTR